MADTSDLKERLRRGARDSCWRAAIALTEVKRERCPIGKTGHLREAINDPLLTSETAPTITLSITIDEQKAPHAEYVINGTVTHEIRAVHAPMLRFYWPDGFNGPGIYYFKRVTHPGTDPNDFFHAQLEDWTEALREELYVEPWFDANSL